MPVPYIYVGDNEALLVAANPNHEEEASVSFDFYSIIDSGCDYSIETLYGQEPADLVVSKELSRVVWRIGRDHSANGGLLVIKLKKQAVE